MKTIRSRLTVALAAGLCSLLSATADAQQALYRGMLIDNNTHLPVSGDDSGNKLGIRANDVQTYNQGGVPWVDQLNNAGQPQGASVSLNDPCNLPSFRRPPGAPWNGTGAAGLVVWELMSNVVPAALAFVADPANANHGFIATAAPATLANYRTAVHATANLWAQTAAPNPPCP